MKYIYPSLENHKLVSEYPNVKGIGTNLFFFDHHYPEDTNSSMMSKLNKKEAEIIVKFSKYIL